jgi:hypothetical protein
MPGGKDRNVTDFVQRNEPSPGLWQVLGERAVRYKQVFGVVIRRAQFEHPYLELVAGRGAINRDGTDQDVGTLSSSREVAVINSGGAPNNCKALAPSRGVSTSTMSPESMCVIGAREPSK